MKKMINKEEIQDAVFCKEKDTVLEVSKILRDTQSRHIIIVNENLKPVGIISTVDINNRVVAEGKNASSLKALDIMTKPIETVELDSDYNEAYRKMIGKGTYSIPVTKDGKLIGLLGFNQLFSKISEKNKGVKKWRA